jgi:dihydrofolate reductase
VRRLVLKMSISVDGYVAGPGGELDWVMRTRSPEGIDWVEQTLWQAGAHLMGRRTYASMVGYWPTSTDQLAPAMNAVPKIVFSRSGSLALEPVAAPAPGWEDTRVLGGDLAADVAALKAESGKDLLAHGGASFAQALVRLGLVDEYRLVVHPVVLGSGLALFAGAEPFDLTLTDATRFPSGTQALVYRPTPGSGG